MDNWNKNWSKYIHIAVENKSFRKKVDWSILTDKEIDLCFTICSIYCENCDVKVRNYIIQEHTGLCPCCKWKFNLYARIEVYKYRKFGPKQHVKYVLNGMLLKRLKKKKREQQYLICVMLKASSSCW